MTSEEAPRKRRGTVASVDIIENPRVAGVGRRRQTAGEGFIARNEGRTVETREIDAAGVTTEHVRPGTVVMYKPTETAGYEPRVVSVSAIRMLIRQGWSEFCPDCRGEHLNREGKPSTDPNLCKARPPVAVRVCSVCHKRLYDNVTVPSASQEEEDDPNVIKDDGAITTPEQRTRLLLDLHLWSKHPRQAQMMGRPPLPTALREIAESVQASV